MTNLLNLTHTTGARPSLRWSGGSRVRVSSSTQAMRFAALGEDIALNGTQLPSKAIVQMLKLFAIALAVAVLGFADGALAQQAKKLFFEGDLVRHTVENQKGPFCVLTNQFKRKEKVAWRIRVLESTGDVADDKVLKSV